MSTGVRLFFNYVIWESKTLTVTNLRKYKYEMTPSRSGPKHIQFNAYFAHGFTLYINLPLDIILQTCQTAVNTFTATGGLHYISAKLTQKSIDTSGNSISPYQNIIGLPNGL